MKLVIHYNLDSNKECIICNDNACQYTSLYEEDMLDGITRIKNNPELCWPMYKLPKSKRAFKYSIGFTSIEDLKSTNPELFV